jgi:hypothetical protein
MDKVQKTSNSYVNTLLHSVVTQGQTDSVYCYLNNAFNIVPHSLSLCKLSNFGLSPPSYVNWFYSYLTNRYFSVHIFGILSSSYTMKSGVPQGSTLGYLFFNI